MVRRREGDQVLPVFDESKPSVQAMLRDLMKDSPELCEYLERRERIGIERYGTSLQPHNGRDVGQDIVEEAIDLVVYLAQHRAEEVHSTTGVYGLVIDGTPQTGEQVHAWILLEAAQNLLMDLVFTFGIPK